MNDSIQKYVEPWLDKVDALSLRERIFLFLSVLACCLAIADTLWLTPTQAANKVLVQQFAAQNAELGRLRDELRVLAMPEDPAKAVRDDIAAAGKRMEAINNELQTLLPQTNDTAVLEQVLMQFLRKQPGLTLVGVNTMSADSGAAAGSTTAGANPAGTATLPAGLTRKGLELRVSGSYAELMQYVQTLEGALPSLRWGSLVLKSETQPPVLTLQVHVLGVQPS
jgi:MSHA biogenesis protein MshJ